MAMTYRDKEPIREKARKLVKQVFAFKDEWASPEIDDFQLLRMAPELVIKHILKYELHRVGAIAFDRDGFEVAGLIDRSRRRIQIAERPTFEIRRFTLAHEIGHAILHPSEVLHRDRPIDGTPRSARPRVEEEADAFAAELLMPLELLSVAFEDRFGGRIDRMDIDKNFAYQLSLASSENLSVNQLRQMQPVEIAFKLAGLDGFGMDFFEPLCRQFGVSRRAMAIQLFDHGFVS